MCLSQVLSLWRGYVVTNKQPLKIELETDRQSLSFSVLHDEDLVAMISHMTTSLKRIFPDSSPGKLLKRVPQDLQERLLTLTGIIEEQLNSQPGPCGGFSDTYAALCDWNEMPFREEIQWDVDNIYYIHNWRRFNLLDFSHLESRDLALAVAALSFNRWFTKIYCKELKLSADIQQQLTFLLSKSSSLEELSLEDCGLKVDFAMKMAAALQEHTSSALKALNLSGNSIEDKGGLGCLGQVLSSCQQFSTSLTHLNLAGNPGSLVTEDATFLFKFLSGTNSLSHLDLSDTNCPLDTLFVSLSAGCCYKLTHLNLARNPFSHRKVREVTRSVQEFFSQSCELRYVGLSATKLPPQALRLLLQGLATNTHLFGLELDLSSCELCSAGAQVIQEHISEATAIRSLDISDNSFENDMVTLVLSVGRCQSLHHLALGRNFAMKSRALTDLLHRIAQLIQDEECPLQSLSVSDSKLKTGMHILLSALGGHTTLSELDISGNNIGDTGAKMLAKALMTNTMLRSLTWDRNNVTARGFQDVADALERNLTLQKMSPPLADITQSYRSNPEQTKEALNKVVYSFKCVYTLQRVSHCNTQAVQNDIMAAHEVLQNARESLKVNISELGQDLMGYAETVCPRVVRRSSVCKSLEECVSKRSKQAEIFLRSTLVETAGQIISTRLSENPSSVQRINVPELRLTDSDFPTDDYSPAFWRSSLLSKSLRPAASIKSKTKQLLATSDMGRVRTNSSLRRRVASVDAAEAVSGDSGASLSPPPSRPPIYSIPYKAPKQEAAGGGGLNGRQARFPGCSPSTGPHPGSGFSVSPMEPLPSQGQTLRHYTAARPRPRRTHTQPPSSRPQEPVSEEKKEDNEAMGRVDEGVEEFFTKKIIPDYALMFKVTVPSSTYFSSPSDIPSSTTTPTTSPSATSTDTSLPSIDVRSLSSSTTFPSTTCSTTTTIPTKNIKKKFGDFFAFKRARAGRAAKTGSGDGGHGAEGVKVKRTSIADLIRPLREAKDRDRGRERDNEREKEREKESEEDANIYNDATTAEGTAAPGLTPAESLTTTQSSEMTPSYPTITTSPELTTSVLSEPEQAAVPAIPHFSTTPAFITTPPEPEAPSYVERRLRVTKRLRENKSQSLILLTGIEPDDKDNTPNKKHASDGTPGFEQRLQVMLHRMGVSKTPPAETKMCQVDRVGVCVSVWTQGCAISSSESRHPLRVQDPNRPEPLYPKPSLPECIMGPLPPKPLSAKLPPPIPAARPSSAPAFTSSSEQVQLTAHTHDGRPMETEQVTHQSERTIYIITKIDQMETYILSRFKILTHSITLNTVRVNAGTKDLESLPKVRQHLKPLPQRRAVSVHEEALTMTQELKAVLQKSPIRFRGNRWDLPSCKEDEAHGTVDENNVSHFVCFFLLISHLMFSSVYFLCGDEFSEESNNQSEVANESTAEVCEPQETLRLFPGVRDGPLLDCTDLY
uniref:Capping protein regulator and myosin 1 linker 2 n=1 Tax=Xiphophorus maculatus TaxID=8083 RepID=M4APG7_XIPMA